MSGGVLLDGRLPSRAELKRDTAYIQQDDALLGWVTVAETLAFTAEMKLPASMPKTQKAARCEEVLDQMGLQLCRNTFVGSRLVRGVSGGERKRTSVACGLLGNPRWCVAHMRARSCRHDAHRLCHASTPYVSLGCGLLVVSQPLPP
jgi:ABC-type multidrug transport system ATPase subunit